DAGLKDILRRRDADFPSEDALEIALAHGHAIGEILDGEFGVEMLGDPDEIGVRMAIGASRGAVLRMVVIDGLKPWWVGLALVLLGVVVLTKTFATLLFGVRTWDPPTLAGVAVVFCVVGVAALYLPARRAARIDSLSVLRNDA